MKRRFFSSNLFLVILVLSFFAGAVAFVFYEPEVKEEALPAKVTTEAPVKVVDSIPKSSAKIKPEPQIEAGKQIASETAVAAGKHRSEESPEAVGAAPGAADFGIEGVVFSLTSGLPLAGCEVSFAGHKVTTDERGEFSLWLDGGVGALRFARDGAGIVQVKHFDICAGKGLTHFDVYLADSGRAGNGRIEVNGVSGRIYSRAGGAPLAHARITIGSRRGLTDGAGFFEIWGNDTALLTMKVSAPGYITEMVSGIDFENQTNPFFYEISLEPENFKTGRRHLALVGIGARLGASEAGYEIVELLENSPAERAGLNPGDILLAVDKLAVDDFSLREVVELIRGQAGQPVTLMVDRDGVVMEFTCVRERVVY